MTYERLFDTLLHGDIVLVLAYCLLDTAITMNLDWIKKTTDFYLADSMLTYLMPRDLDPHEMVLATMGVRHSFAHWQNIVTCDAAHFCNKAYIWEPDRTFDPKKDFHLIKSRAGLTVTGTSGVYDSALVYTMDFSSQYPSIMNGYNVDNTARVSKEQIAAAGMKENIDFITITLTNVRMAITHACTHNECSMRPNINMDEYGKTCKFTSKEEMVHFDIYIVTKKYFLGVAAKCAKALGRHRKQYILLRNIATEKGDKTLALIYDEHQKAAKIRNNGAYGVGMLNDSLCGETVTHFGRLQNRIVANFMCDKYGMKVINADTDSVMAMDKDLGLVGTKDDLVYGLRRLARAVCPDLYRPPTSIIMNLILKRGEKIVNEMNAADFWPHPCKLTFEKVFFYQTIYVKKQYIGTKLLPTGEMCTHVAGLVAKKADKSNVKIIAQVWATRLIRAHDLHGFCRLVNDLTAICNTQLRADEIAQRAVDNICNRIDSKIESFVKDNAVRENPSPPMGEWSTRTPEWLLKRSDDSVKAKKRNCGL